MTKFSANLGFLWPGLALPDAIRAAKAAGFDAVECHAPYDQPVAGVVAALAETGLAMLGINTARGDVTASEMGLAALPGREPEARAAIDQALDYAHAIRAQSVHVMAGVSSGAAARAAYLDNLAYAAGRAVDGGIMILIEPLNRHDAPGYFLSDTNTARQVINEVGAGNLKLMFDCYHVARTEGDTIARLRKLLAIIGHVQFAGVPDRGPPDRGVLDYRAVFRALAEHGWERPLGAEYRPPGATDESLDWMDTLRA